MAILSYLNLNLNLTLNLKLSLNLKYYDILNNIVLAKRHYFVILPDILSLGLSLCTII